MNPDPFAAPPRGTLSKSEQSTMLKLWDVLELVSQIIELLLKSQNTKDLEKTLARARRAHMSGDGWFHPLTVVPSPSKVKGAGINAGGGGF